MAHRYVLEADRITFKIKGSGGTTEYRKFVSFMKVPKHLLRSIQMPIIEYQLCSC